jgi:dihydroflavonol-4-reductase
MRLLVTGATGFVGSTLLDSLPDQADYRRVSVFGLRGDPLLESLAAQDRFEVVYGDITRRADVDRAVQGHSHVIHLAGLISYWAREREQLFRVNHLGVENLVDACLAHGVERLVHVSTVGAVGYYKDGRLADEDTPFNWPKSFHYMGSKLAGQRVVEAAVRERGLPAVILNPASLMGPGDLDPASAHNQLYKGIYTGSLFGSFSGGLAVTDVRDLVAILLKALHLGTPGERYLVVGANLEYPEVIRAIGRGLGARVHPVRIPWPVLTIGGLALELASAVTGRRPLLTAAYGRLSGWTTYYSNRKSVAAFGQEYLPFEKTIADGCAHYLRRYAAGTQGDTPCLPF